MINFSVLLLVCLFSIWLFTLIRYIKEYDDMYRWQTFALEILMTIVLFLAIKVFITVFGGV